MYSTAEVCRLAGVTYRVLDYWCRCGTVRPERAARGSGSARRWTDQQVALVRLCGWLAKAGAERPVLTEVTAQMADLPLELWHGRLVVHPDGTVSIDGPVEQVAWVVDLAACAGQSEQPERTLAVSA